VRIDATVPFVSNGQRYTPIVSVWCKRWCKQWCKRSRRLPVCPGCSDGVALAFGAVEREDRQRVEGAGHVKQARIGVDSHRQLEVAVPHGRLCRSRSNPALTQQRAERRSQGVNVEDAPPVVSLGDAGQLQIAVQDADQTGGHDEHGRIGRQSSGDRLAAFQALGLETFQLVGQPLPQVGGEIVPERDGVPFPVLFVGGVEGGEGNRPVKR